MPIDMLISPILPANEISILAGASGAGKTTILMQIIAAAQGGEILWGLTPRPNLRIGYIFADRSSDSGLHWGKIAQIDAAALKTRSLVDDPTISLAKLSTRPMDLLHELMDSLLPCDLLIVDPFVVFLGGDTKQYSANAAKLILLNRWAQKHHVTILGTHHAAKARTDYGFKRPQDRISGTSALLGYTSTQLFLDTPEESGELHYTFHIIPHNAPAQQIPLTRGHNGLFVPVDPDTLLIDHVPHDPAHPASRAALQQALPTIPPRTLDYHLKKAVQGGSVVQLGKGRYARRPVEES